MKINNFRFSRRSENNLKGVNPALVQVVRRALELSAVDFGVIEGLRTVERQRELFNAVPKKTQTMNSRHITGHAIDVFAYPTANGSWEWKYYEQIAAAFKRASKDVGVNIEWGGDWKTLKDGPHFQLSHKEYQP